MRQALSAVLLFAALAAQAAPPDSPHARRQLADRAQASGFGPLAGPAAAPATLLFSERCVFETLMARRNRTIDPAKPLPPLFLESRTPLKRFQDAIEPQWGQRPDVFLNAYIIRTSEIFLIDEADYYARLGRTVDDSLAHELTHYIQVVYEGGDLMNDPFGSYEQDAIDMQTWFRTEVFPRGNAACSPSR